MTYSLINKCAKNYYNRTFIVPVIAKNVVTCFFLRHSVYDYMLICGIRLKLHMILLIVLMTLVITMMLISNGHLCLCQHEKSKPGHIHTTTTNSIIELVVQLMSPSSSSSSKNAKLTVSSTHLFYGLSSFAKGMSSRFCPCSSARLLKKVRKNSDETFTYCTLTVGNLNRPLRQPEWSGAAKPAEIMGRRQNF